MARAVRFDLTADASRFIRGMRQAERSTKRFTDHTHRAGSAVKTAFAAFSAGAVVFEINKWVAAARDANKVAAQTNAVIESTGGAAGLSAKGFADLAKQISKTAAVDDDLIQGGENILATFTAIKAGGSDKIFERATQAAVDMTAAMNGGVVSAEGLKSANLVLGKALQDPIAGLGKLQRVGVSFNEQQKEQIKTWVEHGEVAKAQGLIISEVNREFGGSAEAAATPAQKLAVAWGDMQEVLGNLLIPAIDKAAVVMTDVLEVVDKNRTAFGILFGVLAGGAAIIGGLILASKIHRAVTDAARVASEAWALTQKGLNLILGVTKVRAEGAAAAEVELTAATKAAGGAAATSKAGFAAGALALGAWGAAAVVAVAQGKQFFDVLRGKSDSILDPASMAIKFVGQQFGFFKDKAKDATGAATDNADAVAANALAQQRATEKAMALTGKLDEQEAKLKTLKDAFKQQTTAVGDTIKAYDGLITASDVTTGQVIGDLHNQVSNFKTYSKDVKRLIKAGVSPDAIQELSQKGPQYVHALAEGSNAQLKKYKGYWHDRQAEVKGSFAASMKLQYDDLVKKIQAMNKEIQKLKGKLVPVGVEGTVHWDKNAALLKSLTGNFSHKLPAFAAGGLLGGYGGGDRRMILAEDGEAIVPKHLARRPEFQGWAADTGIPGFQAGGQVGAAPRKLVPPSSDALRYSSRSALSGASALHGLDALSMLGGGIGGGSGPGGWRWQMAVLRSAFPGLQLISGFRPGAVTHATGRQSYHAVGRAVDVPPRMDVFNFIRGAYGKRTKELIFSPAGMRQIHNGQPHMYTGVTRADHWNHVHWAYDKGGMLPPGTSLATNNTGRPEPVGFDYDKLAAAIVRAQRDNPPVVFLDRQKVSRAVRDGALWEARR